MPGLRAVTTREDLGGHLRGVLVRTGKTLRRLERETVRAGIPLRRETLSQVTRGRHLPRKDWMLAFLNACGVPAGEHRSWIDAWERVAVAEDAWEGARARPGGNGSRTAAPRSGGDGPRAPGPRGTATGEADLRIDLRPWVGHCGRQRHPAADAVLRGEGAWTHPGVAGRPIDAALAALPALLDGLLSEGGTVEAVTAFRALTVPITSAKEFWALLAADVVLSRGDEGSRRWLVERSGRILGGRQDRAQIRRVWRTLFDVFLRPDDTVWPIEEVVDDVARVLGSTPDRLSRVVGLLLTVVGDDDAARGRLHRALAAYEASLPDDAPPELRVPLRRLTSEAAGPVGRRPPVFAPEFVTVPEHAWGAYLPRWRGVSAYEFEAMVRPLSMGDAAAVLGADIGPGERYDPYVMDLSDWGEDRPLPDIVSDLVSRCCVANRGSDRVWFVPTAAEWLALSGCETHDHPWGDEPPTPARANLRHRPAGELLPLGVHPAGRSPHGVGDCCGGVHELVQWLPDVRAPGAFRLAGGCHTTRPEHASCRRFRPLTPGPSGRRNVGIRLIRYDGRHAGARAAVLRRLGVALRPPA